MSVWTAFILAGVVIAGVGLDYKQEIGGMTIRYAFLLIMFCCCVSCTPKQQDAYIINLPDPQKILFDLHIGKSTRTEVQNMCTPDEVKMSMIENIQHTIFRYKFNQHTNQIIFVKQTDSSGFAVEKQYSMLHRNSFVTILLQFFDDRLDSVSVTDYGH